MKLIKHKIKIVIIVLLAFFYTSCVNLDTDYEPIKSTKISTEKGKWEQIINLKIPDDSDLLFDFESGKALTNPNDYYSDKWDILINRNSYDKDIEELRINNYYMVYGGKYQEYKDIFGKVLGVLLPKKFEEVTEAPDPEKKIYNRRISTTGTFFKSIKGYEYIITQGDGEYDWGEQVYYDDRKAPIGWLISEYYKDKDKKEDDKKVFLQKVLPNRTFVFRTNEGSYVKLEIQNIYKDNPEIPTPKSEKGYLSFRYFIQKDGSRNLNTN